MTKQTVAAYELIQTLARMTPDGEAQADGTAFDMVSDDAVKTLNLIIRQARKVASMTPSPACPECKGVGMIDRCPCCQRQSADPPDPPDYDTCEICFERIDRSVQIDGSCQCTRDEDAFRRVES